MKLWFKFVINWYNISLLRRTVRKTYLLIWPWSIIKDIKTIDFLIDTTYRYYRVRFLCEKNYIIFLDLS